jgi:hypothetical protein
MQHEASPPVPQGLEANCFGGPISCKFGFQSTKTFLGSQKDIKKDMAKTFRHSPMHSVQVVFIPAHHDAQPSLTLTFQHKQCKGKNAHVS